jgi:cyclase
MKTILLTAFAGAALICAGPVIAQQQTDFSKVEIKTTDLGHNTYMLQGQGGNITFAVGNDAIIMVDSEFAPLHDKIKAAIAKISPLPIKYLVNTHFHGDHTGGNALFHKDGATIVAQDNIRVRLAAGTVNGLNGNKTPPAPADALPTNTYIGGNKELEVGGLSVLLRHVNNAHTDGDTWVYFPNADVIATGDTFSNGRYPNIDFANGGGISGMINAANAYLEHASANTEIVPGHGPLATREQLEAYRDMLLKARDRIRPMFQEGYTEQEVVAARPMKDLDSKWAANDRAAENFLRGVYNSFKRS